MRDLNSRILQSNAFSIFLMLAERRNKDFCILIERIAQQILDTNVGKQLS